MQTTGSRDVYSLFQSLDGPEALLAGAEQDSTSADRLRVNAHIHLPPNFSAFDTVGEAVGLAAEQGVGALGASNYYDYRVYADFAEQASRCGIFPLFGIEIITLNQDLARAGIKINDPGNPGKMYLCGKGIAHFDPLTPEAAGLLDVIRSKDSERMARMTDRLAELFAAAGLETGLNEDAIKEQVARRHGSPKETVYLQERHVAQAFQEALFDRISSSRPRGGADPPVRRRSESRGGRGHRAVRNPFASDEGGKARIRSGDVRGLRTRVPAHPRAGRHPVLPDARRWRLSHLRLRDAGRDPHRLDRRAQYPLRRADPGPQHPGDAGALRSGDAAGRPRRHGRDRAQHPRNAADRAGMPRGPADSRSDPGDLPRGRLCGCRASVSGAARRARLLSISEGRPNAAYATAEERIEAFRKLGAAVIHRFRQMYRAAAPTISR